MELRWLKPLLGRPAPFTTVYLDATRAESAGEAEAAERWRALRRDLVHEGAPSTILDEIGDLVAQPTRVHGQHVHGPHGRVIVADAEGVRIDRVLAEPPVTSWALHGPFPALLPVSRTADQSTRYLLVEVDRQGADLTWTDETGRLARDQVGVVEGGHDIVHKGNEAGLSLRRTRDRAEDSWERNAQVVAAAIDKRVAEKPPELVVVTGDVRAVALVHDSVGQRVRGLWVEVPGGSRGEGAKQEAFAARLEAALRAFRVRRREETLELFRTDQGRGVGAVTELGDVIEVLRRGQVRELLLLESVASAASPIAGRSVWVGPDPLQIGLTKADLAAIGVTEDARQLPVDVALLRAAIGQDAGLTLATDGAVELVDGVGALLRWTDVSTPSEAVPSLSSDQKRLRSIV
jgi:hypothetical protein